MARSKRSKACDISDKVRKEVRERDKNACIFCGVYGSQVAHFVGRSQGGLGIPQNLILACVSCHYRLDQTDNRESMKEYAREYLKSKYPDWDEEKLYYRKW